uniref:Uncharacterized protein n=1 Tax=Anguilla anguilla TaxID=7936 RepID=A0A0E9T689_ANGAN
MSPPPKKKRNGECIWRAFNSGFKKPNLPLIHPSIHHIYPLILVRVADVLEPITACISQEAEIHP